MWLVHIHKQHVAAANIHTNSVLRETRFATGIFAMFNDCQIAEPVYIISFITVDCGAEVYIGSNSSKCGAGYFKIGLIRLLSLGFVMCGR